MVSTFIMMTAAAFGGSEAEGEVWFERQRLGDVTYESASAVDINNNGVMDIVSGEYWFEGPDFETQHKITDIRQEGTYYDSFSDYPMDVNGNGYMDIITGGWFNESVRWRENPEGEPVEWETHDIATVGNVERPCFWDITGDGHVEITPNTPNNPQRIFRLIRDEEGRGTGEFEEYTISSQNTGHGLGFGDINGNGRGDFVSANGWFEHPENPLEDEWPFHADFELGSASVPILVHDVNGNGLNDLIVGEAHDYGLYWMEQQLDDEGNRSWEKHMIDPDRSQYHDLQLADIDNDGELDLITGKRYWAHQGGDPGAEDPVGLYYFKINGGEFERVTIDYGPPEEASGAGIYFWVEDITGNGWKDIIAPGKEGVYLFRNQGLRE